MLHIPHSLHHTKPSCSLCSRRWLGCGLAPNICRVRSRVQICPSHFSCLAGTTLLREKHRTQCSALLHMRSTLWVVYRSQCASLSAREKRGTCGGGCLLGSCPSSAAASMAAATILFRILSVCASSSTCWFASASGTSCEAAAWLARSSALSLRRYACLAIKGLYPIPCWATSRSAWALIHQTSIE